MFTTDPRSRGLGFAIATRMLALALGTLAFVHDAAADERAAAARAAAMPLAALERAFWWCDHAATTRGVEGVDGVACMAVFDEFKKRRFDGDFDRLVAWWRDHKPAQHRKLELSQREDNELVADEGGTVSR